MIIFTIVGDDLMEGETMTVLQLLVMLAIIVPMFYALFGRW